MSPSRTVVVGSAVPLLILIVLVGLPPTWAAVGLEQADPALLGSSTGLLAARDAASTDGGGSAAAADEQLALTRLRRSISAGRDLAFTGTEVVSVWHLGRSTTRVLNLEQGVDGVRLVAARDDETDGHPIAASVTDALAGLSDRALDALAAGYDLHTGGDAAVVGRGARVVTAERGGLEVARMWLDRRTGLLLRQDVRDSAGRLHRTAAFTELEITDPGTAAGSATPATPLRPRAGSFGIGELSVPAVRRFDRLGPQVTSPAPGANGPWSDVVGPAELATLRGDGWPCPVALPAGFVLLDARRQTLASGRSTLHLTYGDGLSAISVFLQRGELDPAGLADMSRRKWEGTEVFVRAGWPEVMVWQGGPMVITAVGDAEPSDLQAILAALPRQSNHGRLGSLQQRMGSAWAWFSR